MGGWFDGASRAIVARYRSKTKPPACLMQFTKRLSSVVLTSSFALLAAPVLGVRSYAAQDLGLAKSVGHFVGSGLKMAGKTVEVVLQPLPAPVPDISNSAILLVVGMALVALANRCRKNRRERESFSG